MEHELSDSNILDTILAPRANSCHLQTTKSHNTYFIWRLQQLHGPWEEFTFCWAFTAGHATYP